MVLVLFVCLIRMNISGVYNLGRFGVNLVFRNYIVFTMQCFCQVLFMVKKETKSSRKI